MSEDTTLDASARAVQIVMGLSQDEFDSLIDVLNKSDVPTSQTRLERLAASAMSSPENGETIAQFGLAYAGNLFWGNYNADRTIKRMAEMTGGQVGAEPDAVETRLRALFGARAILLVAGAQSGRRQTAGLVDRLAFQMDLRPVIHPDGGKVEMYGIYHRLHLVVTDDEAGAEEKTIEVVLDYADLKKLEKDATSALEAQRGAQKALTEAGSTVYLPMPMPKEE